MRLIVVALLLTAVLAGCAERQEAISAREGLGPALEAARAHGDDPVLVGIESVEPFKHLSEEDYEVWIHLDKNPGDGRAPGWLYTFASGDRTIAILYAAGLGVLAEGYTTDEEELGGMPIEDWVLDSPAVAKLLAKQEHWPAAADDTTVFWSLRQDETGPKWFVEWSNATLVAEAFVDARTGNVSQVERWEHVMLEATCDLAQAGGGAVTPLEGQSVSVEVPQGGELTYSFGWDMTLGEAEMSVTGPEGEIESDTLSDTGAAMGSFTQLPGGRYTLAFEATLGVGEVHDLILWTCG